MKRKTTVQFIKESKDVHGDEYDYSLVNYVNSNNKVKIICKEHSVFEQTPNNHISKKYGCPSCSGNKKFNNDIFISKSNEIHNNKYDYSLVNYINAHTKIKIICKKHGEFTQPPNKHLHKHGCPLCSRCVRKTTDQFVVDAKSIHGDEYDYSLVEYKNSKTKVKIICKKHGVFTQTPDSHINKKTKCPKCGESVGERYIREYLEKKEFDYSQEKTFNGCEYKSKLKFDFYLPEYNLCIEFDGIQHYESIEYFGGIDALRDNNIKDTIKNVFCDENDINLLRIKYTDDINGVLNGYNWG